MSIRRILRHGEDSLRAVCSAVGEIDDSVRALIQDLKDTLNSTTGIGLAAPQIGESKRVFIYDIKRDRNPGEYRVVINGKITDRGAEIVSEGEGCKSAPQLRVDVRRAEYVSVEGEDEAGNQVCFRAEGLEAIAIQHEIDHLEGVCITNHLPPSERSSYERYLKSVALTEASAIYSRSLASIRGRLEPFVHFKDGVLFTQRFSNHQVFVVKAGTQIQLFFAQPGALPGDLNVSGIMSRVDIKDPLMLLGLYTQAMMLCLLWRSEPELVYVMGFGGGRLPMVLAHYYTKLVVESTEIDPVVVSLAKKYFGITLDSRVKVAIEDARDYLAGQASSVRYDFIIVDCFSGAGSHPFSLSTVEFYQLCQRHLVDGGVVTSNLVPSDPFFDEKVFTFISSFKYAWRFRRENADVLFGSDHDLVHGDAMVRAGAIAGRFGFSFPFEELVTGLERASVDESKSRTLLSDGAQGDWYRNVPSGDPLFHGAKRNDPCPCGSGKKFKKCHGSV